MNLILGDLNAIVSSERCQDVVADYGLGGRSERGEKLIQFCQEQNLTIMNTNYKLNKTHLFTWRSTPDTPNQIVIQ